MEEQQTNTSMQDSIGALLSNPDLIRRVGAVLGSLNAQQPDAAKDNAETSADTALPTATLTQAAPSPDGLMSVLTDPAMMEKLPAMMAAIKPLMGTIQPSKPSADSNSPEACRDRLLLALKPFLSNERRQAVDSILRIAKLSTVFRELK